MKCLTLYLHKQSTEDVLDCLRESPLVTGFTLTHGEGHSLDSNTDWSQAAIDRVVGFVPRVRVEVILEDDQVEEVLAALKASLSSTQSHAVWSVVSLDGFGRL